MLAYEVELLPDDNDTLLVRCPDLPIVVTFGSNESDALRHACDAIQVALASMIDDRDEIPEPQYQPTETSRTVRVPLQAALKVGLYSALKSAGLTRADLQRKLGWQRESVDRLFRLDHNSRIEQLDQAFSAIGKTVNVEILEAA